MGFLADEALLEQLERLIDTKGLRKVVAALTDVCYGKAEHLETNWSDHALAGLWRDAGDRLERCRFNLPLLP